MAEGNGNGERGGFTFKLGHVRVTAELGVLLALGGGAWKAFGLYSDQLQLKADVAVIKKEMMATQRFKSRTALALQEVQIRAGIEPKPLEPLDDPPSAEQEAP